MPAIHRVQAIAFVRAHSHHLRNTKQMSGPPVFFQVGEPRGGESVG
jgi:hypothetical protein